MTNKSRRDFCRSMTGALLVGASGGSILFHSCGHAQEPDERAASLTQANNGRNYLTVDIHCHGLVPEMEPYINQTDGWAAQEARGWGSFSTSITGEIGRKLTSLETRLSIMDAMGVDIQAISPSPTQYYYYAPRDIAEEIIQIQNEKLAEFVAETPDRFVGMGGVALQHPDLAVQQLDHAVNRLDLRGVMISSHIEGEDLNSSRFEPFWAKAVELDVLVFIHPMGFTQPLRFRDYFMGNVVAQPLETSIAISHLIFGGVLDRYPGLKICTAHGGGYLASYIGRAERCYEIDPRCQTIQKRPLEYLRDLYHDSIVFTEESLQHLVRQVGPDRILLGSDYPYDLGDPEPARRLMALDRLSEENREAMLGGTAAELLRIQTA